MTVKNKKTKLVARYILGISVLAFTAVLLIIFPLKTFYKPKNEYVGTYTAKFFDWEDSSKNTSSQKITLSSGETYDLNLDKVTAPPVPNTYITVSGEIKDGVLVADSASEITSDPSHPKASQAASGKLSTAVIRMAFHDKPGVDPISTTAITNLFFNDTTSVNKFFTADSFGIFQGIDSANYKVSKTYTIAATNPGNCDGFESWTTDVKTLISQDTDINKVDLSKYQRVVYVFPFVGATCWSALGEFNGKQIWMNGPQSSAVFIHEFSHTLGVGHADICSDTACSTITYGDTTDIMGFSSTSGSTPPHNSSAFKAVLGWLTPYSAVPTEQGNTYNLYPIEVKTSNIQALTLSKDDTGESYYLTYRNKSDTFDNISSIDKAVYLHILTSRRGTSGDPVGVPTTLLVKKLVSGGVYQDTRNGIEIDVTAISSSYATIFVKKIAGTIGSNGTIIPTSPPSGGTATPLPNLDIGGYVWDTNMKGVSGMTMAIEGYGSSGAWKAYNPVTNSDGFFKQGGFIVYGGAYNVKANGVVKTLSYTISRNTVTGLDTPQGSLAYLNQRGDFNDCAHVSSFRCNFLAQKSLDTPSTISDVTSFIWQSSNPANKNKYSYRRTYLSTDGKTFYRKDCFFDRLVEYPVICSGYLTGTVDTPGTVKGYGAFVFPEGGTKQWIRQSYIGTNGTTYYWRVCQWDVTKGEPVANTCEPYSTVQVTTPTAVKSVETTFIAGYLYQSFVSSDGTKEYRRSCAFNMTTFASSGCTAFTTTTLPATMNGNSEFIYVGGYNALKVQQFYVGSDGRKPYFRTCNWNGSGTSASISCPSFF